VVTKRLKNKVLVSVVSMKRLCRETIGMIVPPPRMIEEAAGIGRDTERANEGWGVSNALGVATGELPSGMGGNGGEDDLCDLP
jgi:hypothetical protein